MNDAIHKNEWKANIWIYLFEKLNIMNNILISFLKTLHMKHTSAYAEKLYEEYPHKYNLYGLSKMLEEYPMPEYA